MTPKYRYIEILLVLFSALFAAMLLRHFVIAAYKIPTRSMEKTLLSGDFLLVSKFIYGAEMPEWIRIPGADLFQSAGTPAGFRMPEWLRWRIPPLEEPQANDIIIFKHPKNPGQYFVKRCIAAGNQTITIKDKTVYVDGKPLSDRWYKQHVDPVVLKRRQQNYPVFQTDLGSRDNFGPLKIPENQYFVLGDNRDISSDSRQWGLVPREKVVGKPLWVYLSVMPDISLENIFNKIRWKRIGMVIR